MTTLWIWWKISGGDMGQNIILGHGCRQIKIRVVNGALEVEGL